MTFRPLPHVLLSRRLAIVGLVAAILLGPALRAIEPESDVRLVIAVTRHGVRSPIYGDDVLGKYAAEPWPVWSVPPGYLTPHGHQQMVLMGSYFRALYTAEGLLTGDAALDRPRVYFRSDSDQRTIATARDLAAGLLPATEVDPHSRPLDQLDPMFRAAMLPIGHPDYPLAVSSVLGRIGGDPAILTEACAPAFVTLRHVLFGDAAELPAGKVDPRDVPTAVERGTRDHTVNIRGPVRVAMQVTDNLMLEYAEGMPMKDVGWGRVTRAELTELIRMHSLYFDLSQGVFYPTQVQGSNLASHLLATLRQAATGRADPAAFGTPANRLVMVVGHDSNIINLGGLMGLSWWLPGTQRNPVLPGGALVFELRQRRSDRQYVVRISYLSQSLDQIRNLDPLTLEHPPGRSPIFIPGCSEAGPNGDAPLGRFEALLERVIDPAFVLPDPS